MTPDQLASRVADLANALRLELRREIETVATTGQAMVIDRVSETGKDSRGVAFKPYTPEWEAKKRQAVGGKASAKKRKDRATAPATPEKPQGRYRGIVDFTFTGRMLSNIGLGEIQDTDKGVRVVVAGRTEETRAKMEGNDKYRPGWFTLSKSEKEELKRQSAARLANFAQRFITQ